MDKPRSSRELTSVERPRADGSISDPTLGSDGALAEGQIPAGQVIAGRYRILELLGAGGMGAVYRARDLTLGADVALKTLAPELSDDPERVANFRGEVLLARRVTHANVCRLHDIIETDDGWFISMEHIEGESLADRLRRADRRADGDFVGRGRQAPTKSGNNDFASGLQGAALKTKGSERSRFNEDSEAPIDLAFALSVIGDVARGLAAAHAVGVVHRDLKPGNVLLRAGDGRAVIADFGIAVEVNQLGRAVVDRAGTRGYMSPEQAAGDDIDARTDVFALGVLAHRMLAGELPPMAPTTVAHTEESDPPAPVPEDVPPALAALIARCLRRDPAERFADAAEVVAALESLDVARPAPGRRARAIGSAVIAAALAAAAVAGYASGDDAPLPLAPPGQIVVGAIDVARVDAPRADWVATAFGRRLVNELDDAWALPARLETDPGPEPSAGDAAATLSIASDSRGLVATVSIAGRLGAGERIVRGATLRELSMEAARAIAEVAVPAPLRRPTGVELALSGTRDAEAWRWTRRSQRVSIRQLWSQARRLSAEALARDPRSVAANLELGWTYSADTPDLRPYFEAAIDESKRARLDAGWTRAVEFAAASLTGKPKAISEAMEAAVSAALTYRQRWYFTHRVAYALWYAGAREDALPHVEQLEARYPRSAGAAKLLATHFLARDDAEARTLALQHARLAVARGADDVASHAELARALLWDGKRAEALEHVALIEAADDEDKASAVAGGEETNSVFDLYMALGDFGAADRAARRMETGTLDERGRATLVRAMLLLYRGDVEGGLERARQAASLFDDSGTDELIGNARRRIAAVAHSLGRAELVLQVVGELPPARINRFHRVIAAIAKHRLGGALAEAEALVAELPDGHSEKAFLGVLIAAEAGDWDRVLALEDGAARWRRHLEARYLLGVARERAGDRRAAVAHHEKLAFHRYAWSEPIWASRSLLAAARLRAELGETDIARARYQTYLDRHDRALPSHAGVAEARRALAALGPSR